MDFLSINHKDKILIVAPHPDDEVIGSGGILALYPAQCHVIIMTDGRLGDKRKAPEIVKRIRRAEVKQEAALISEAVYELLDYEDGKLCNYIDALEYIDFNAYTKVFVTNRTDGHPDHWAAYQCVMNAIVNQKAERTEVFSYEVHSPIDEPDYIFDVTDIIDRKEDLIKCHESQLALFPYAERMRSLAVYRGYQYSLAGRYLEVYKKETAFEKAIPHGVEHNLQKFRLFYDVLVRWLLKSQQGLNVAEILQNAGYKTVAIYGYAELGQLLKNEIMTSGLQLLYIMDKRIMPVQDVAIIKPDEACQKPDVVIVTAVYYFNEIVEELTGLGFNNVISLQELVS